MILILFSGRSLPTVDNRTNPRVGKQGKSLRRNGGHLARRHTLVFREHDSHAAPPKRLRQTGWIVDNIFGSNTRRQAINSSKLVIPVGERSVRILPGATAANDKVTTRNNSLRVTVDPESWVNVPVYVEGEITDEVVPMQRVSITPYLDSQDAIRVSASPLNDSTYDPATGTFYLYYRYQLATESGNTWHEVRETMTRSQY